MCKYCEDTYKEIKNESIIPNGIGYLTFLDYPYFVVDSQKNGLDFFKIKYCPMCGERL